jgi:HAD superfamily hydrolase (TIGR01459 family)
MSEYEQIRILSSIEEIARNYDAWLVDLWGVMHNGESAIPQAIDACRRYREEGGIVILLSNAPRPWPSVRAQIEGYGVPSGIDDGIITSGDVTRALIAANAGKRFFHLGPERDRPVFEGLEAPLVGPDEADMVVLTGLYDDNSETPDDYRSLLERLARRSLPMICANPDIKVERGKQVIYAAGAIARLYEQMGGEVAYAGKPHRPIYDLALARITELAGREIRPDQLMAIGDGVDTDIRGAIAYGIDPVFVPSGVHMTKNTDEEEIHKAIETVFAGRPFTPLAAITTLRW